MTYCGIFYVSISCDVLLQSLFGLIFLGTKLYFVTQYYATEHAEQDKIDAKWLGEKRVNFPT